MGVGEEAWDLGLEVEGRSWISEFRFEISKGERCGRTVVRGRKPTSYTTWALGETRVVASLQEAATGTWRLASWWDQDSEEASTAGASVSSSKSPMGMGETWSSSQSTVAPTIILRLMGSP